MRAPPMPRYALPAAALLIAVAGGGCTSLPPLGERSATVALADTGDTQLGKAIAPLAVQHPGLSGVLPLPDGRDAFAARVLLARSAERSLDVQYYIWRDDLTGVLLLDELRNAAARGVRVRLLLDDNNTAGLDPCSPGWTRIRTSTSACSIPLPRVAGAVSATYSISAG
jgi:putative cardiolipin synthase